jgi:hypothetical protein
MPRHAGQTFAEAVDIALANGPAKTIVYVGHARTPTGNT